MTIFKSLKEAEEYLEKTYKNKIIQLTYYTQFQEKTYTGKVDNISIGVTKEPHIIICFNDGKRFEVDKDEFANLVKKLN